MPAAARRHTATIKLLPLLPEIGGFLFELLVLIVTSFVILPDNLWLELSHRLKASQCGRIGGGLRNRNWRRSVGQHPDQQERNARQAHRNRNANRSRKKPSPPGRWPLRYPVPQCWRRY